MSEPESTERPERVSEEKLRAWQNRARDRKGRMQLFVSVAVDEFLSAMEELRAHREKEADVARELGVEGCGTAVLPLRARELTSEVSRLTAQVAKQEAVIEAARTYWNLGALDVHEMDDRCPGCDAEERLRAAFEELDRAAPPATEKG